MTQIDFLSIYFVKDNKNPLHSLGMKNATDMTPQKAFRFLATLCKHWGIQSNRLFAEFLDNHSD
jgi:hypothetical protein